MVTNEQDRFVNYYAVESLKQSTLDRFAATKDAVIRAAKHFRVPEGPWCVADIGCGAATQCALWAREGHTVFGADINQQLVDLGRQRLATERLNANLSVGSATQLPWPDASMDICLCPELLEHVDEWQLVIREAVRVLRLG